MPRFMPQFGAARFASYLPLGIEIRGSDVLDKTGKAGALVMVECSDQSPEHPLVYIAAVLSVNDIPFTV